MVSYLYDKAWSKETHKMRFKIDETKNDDGTYHVEVIPEVFYNSEYSNRDICLVKPYGCSFRVYDENDNLLGSKTLSEFYAQSGYWRSGAQNKVSFNIDRRTNRKNIIRLRPAYNGDTERTIYCDRFGMFGFEFTQSTNIAGDIERPTGQATTPSFYWTGTDIITDKKYSMKSVDVEYIPPITTNIKNKTEFEKYYVYVFDGSEWCLCAANQFDGSEWGNLS